MAGAFIDGVPSLMDSSEGPTAGPPGPSVPLEPTIGDPMARLIRMDQTGHTTLAEWTADDPEAVERAVQAFRHELDRGYFGMVSTGEGHAEQVKELPVDAETVILRLPIAGG
jgi:hypothetical protein